LPSGPPPMGRDVVRTAVRALTGTEGYNRSTSSNTVLRYIIRLSSDRAGADAPQVLLISSTRFCNTAGCRVSSLNVHESRHAVVSRPASSTLRHCPRRTCGLVVSLTSPPRIVYAGFLLPLSAVDVATALASISSICLCTIAHCLRNWGSSINQYMGPSLPRRAK